MPKLFFPEGMGVVQNSSENSGGVGGYFTGQKMEIPRRGGEGVWLPFQFQFHCIVISGLFHCVVSRGILSRALDLQEAW